jgi:5-methylcytosine-specific restriction endonuclease McrA
MEMLHLIPKHQSFEEAILLIENLGQSRPAMVQSLLEKCNSIKVKRLFLYLSERFQHPWLSNLDLKKIDLGRGKRVIGRGGEYDAKYLLSVPKIVKDWLMI